MGEKGAIKSGFRFQVFDAHIENLYVSYIEEYILKSEVLFY